MPRAQLVLPEALRREAKRLAAQRGVSLGAFVREAVAEYVLSWSGAQRPGSDPLLDDSFDDPRPDPTLSVDVDHHLYGAPRRSERTPRRRRAPRP